MKRKLPKPLRELCMVKPTTLTLERYKADKKGGGGEEGGKQIDEIEE